MDESAPSSPTESVVSSEENFATAMPNLVPGSELGRVMKKAFLRFRQASTHAADGRLSGTSSATGYIVHIKENGDVVAVGNSHFFKYAHYLGYARNDRSKARYYNMKSNLCDDYGFVTIPAGKLDPDYIQAAKLYPKEIPNHTKVRLLGNDDGARGSELEAIIARNRENPPATGPLSSSYNVFYYGAMTHIVGGSSGSLAFFTDLRSDGYAEAIGMMCASNTRGGASWLLPSYVIAEGLKYYLADEVQPWGTDLTRWDFQYLPDCKTAGISDELVKEISDAVPDFEGLLSASVVIKDSPIKDVIPLGSLLISIDDQYITHFSQLRDAYNKSIGKNVTMKAVSRGEIITHEFQVQDLYNYAYDGYLCFSGSIFENVNFKTSFCNEAPAKTDGVLIAAYGNLINMPDTQDWYLKTITWDKKQWIINNLDDLAEFATTVPHGATINMTMCSMWNTQETHRIGIVTHGWNSISRCVFDPRHSVWEKTIHLDHQQEGTVLDYGPDLNFPVVMGAIGDGNLIRPAQPVGIEGIPPIITNMAYGAIDVSAYCETSDSILPYGARGSKAFLVDSTVGLIIAPLSFAPAERLKVFVQIWDRRIPALVLPFNGKVPYALLKVDPTLLQGFGLPEVSLLDRMPEQGETVVAITASLASPEYHKTTIADVTNLIATIHARQKWTATATTHLVLQKSIPTHFGASLITTMDGKVCGYLTGVGSSFSPHGMLAPLYEAYLTAQAIQTKTMRIPMTLGIKFKLALPAHLGMYHVPDVTMRRLFSIQTPFTAQALLVRETLAGSLSSLERDDLVVFMASQREFLVDPEDPESALLSPDSPEVTVVTRIHQIDNIPDEGVYLSVLRKGKMEVVHCKMVPFSQYECTKILDFQGATFQETPPARWLEFDNLPEGVFVGEISGSSTTFDWNLCSSTFVQTVNGNPTPTLNAFLGVMDDIPNNGNIQINVSSTNQTYADCGYYASDFDDRELYERFPVFKDGIFRYEWRIVEEFTPDVDGVRALPECETD